MNRRCPNCAGRITFNIEKQKLICSSCESIFGVDEFSSEDEVLKDTSKNSHKLNTNTYKSNIYICNSCGAQISVTSTETSTFCVYCGNATVVFSHIENLKKPEFIIPFKITKEEAIKRINEKLNKGFYIPKEIKNYEIEHVRGIYIPYYITKVEFDGSYVFSTEEIHGKQSQTYYYKRSAYATMPWITTDASTTLNDASSQRLEPYDVFQGKVFDEDYLLGFYSDISDVEEIEATSFARVRAREVFEKELFKDIPGKNKKIVNCRYNAEVFDNPVTAMLPAWFLTFRYQDKPYTIIVNGQTGKVVGGVPWNKNLFIVVTTLLCLFFASLLAVICALLMTITYNISILSIAIVGGIVLLSLGIKKIKRVINSINLTGASTLNAFVNKRQKGN